MFDLGIPEEALDDAGIFAMVVLATITLAVGLYMTGYSLWFTVPAFLLLAVAGELVARKLAALKGQQLEGGGEA